MTAESANLSADRCCRPGPSQCPLHQVEPCALYPVPCTLHTAGCGNSCNNVGGVVWCDGAGWVQRATVTEHDNTGSTGAQERGPGYRGLCAGQTLTRWGHRLVTSLTHSPLCNCVTVYL